jgi:hypothetical protein
MYEQTCKRIWGTFVVAPLRSCLLSNPSSRACSSIPCSTMLLPQLRSHTLTPGIRDTDFLELRCHRSCCNRIWFGSRIGFLANPNRSYNSDPATWSGGLFHLYRFLFASSWSPLLNSVSAIRRGWVSNCDLELVLWRFSSFFESGFFYKSSLHKVAKASGRHEPWF